MKTKILCVLCACAGHGIRPKEVAREVANPPTKAGNRKAKADREATRRCESSGGPVAGTPSQWQRRRREASVGRKSEAKPWSEEYETPTRQPPEEARAKERAGRKPEGHRVLAAVEAADRWGERRVSYPGNPALLPVS